MADPKENQTPDGGENQEESPPVNRENTPASEGEDLQKEPPQIDRGNTPKGTPENQVEPPLPTTGEMPSAPASLPSPEVVQSEPAPPSETTPPGAAALAGKTGAEQSTSPVDSQASEEPTTPSGGHGGPHPTTPPAGGELPPGVTKEKVVNVSNQATREYTAEEMEKIQQKPLGKILLEVRNLKKHFPIRKGLFSRVKGYVKAVDDVSFTVRRGETVGLVGESGCGKTTAGRTILKLIPPTSGEVLFEGKDVFKATNRELLNLRKEMQIIFQDPFSSLNPRMTVSQIVGEGMLVHKICRGKELEDRVSSLLKRVGLSPDHRNRYPHEFSGGQRQRIGIARALSVDPQFIVCDESVSALDVSIQAQVINLLKGLQEEMGLSYLFIAHDLAVVEHISDRVAVMYLGHIVESADARDLYNNPRHPYTRALLSAIPVPNPKRKVNRIILEGDVPTPINPPPGCPFHTRCPIATDKCKSGEFPPAVNFGNDHVSFCHYANEPEIDEVPIPDFQPRAI